MGKRKAFLFLAYTFVVFIIGEQSHSLNFFSFNSFNFGSNVQSGSVLSQETKGKNKIIPSAVAEAADSPNSQNEKQYQPEDWDANYYSQIDSEGFLCPNFWSGFQAPVAWNKQNLPAVFSKIEVTYEVKNQNNDDASLPTLIFALGKDPALFRFYLPQKTKQSAKPQYVGFQKIKSGEESGLAWVSPPQPLSSPMELSQSEIVLRITPQQKKENIATYNFNVKYLSALTNRQEEDSFSYDVNIPSPDIENYQTTWGIGTFKGNCFKIKKYEVL